MLLKLVSVGAAELGSKDAKALLASTVLTGDHAEWKPLCAIKVGVTNRSLITAIGAPKLLVVNSKGGPIEKNVL
jgi:hypothetical protein